ncbi:MAG TPA: ABC transporter ATP-binding protein [Polyangia bacterium]|jgi:ABC-2 type transport system ATP-binding protein|nr:ABC transporter ATP-binding protein [Polyangia bacterium]
MPTPAVETDALVKRYPNVEALRGVSLSIEPGEIFALLGPNGAGKTTWISIVCGLTTATAGSARVYGHDVVDDAMSARRIVGLVPQEINFDPFFTPREVLRFQMGYFGVPPSDARVDELLAAMSLTSKADVTSRELSGGMRRRLLIAKALVHRPRVAFLDEPTAGVDIALRKDLWTYVRKLRDEGTTIVLTTHYLEEAEELADRVAVIDRGTLIAVDKPAVLLEQHGKKQAFFRLAEPLAVPLTDKLRALGATLDDARTTVSCPIEGDASDVLAAVAALPDRVLDMRTEQPSLEQVFLALTTKGAA